MQVYGVNSDCSEAAIQTTASQLLMLKWKSHSKLWKSRDKVFQMKEHFFLSCILFEKNQNFVYFAATRSAFKHPTATTITTTTTAVTTTTTKCNSFFFYHWTEIRRFCRTLKDPFRSFELMLVDFLVPEKKTVQFVQVISEWDVQLKFETLWFIIYHSQVLRSWVHTVARWGAI